MTVSTDIPVRVTDIETVAEGVKRFRFATRDGSKLPEFSGGAHTVVTMRDGDTVRRNPYSLMSSPFDGSHYEISVLRTVDSRGGSVFMHDKVKVGSEMMISQPVNLFPIDRRGRKHLLIAGGIGITPFMSMMNQLDREEMPFELYYCNRSPARGAYIDRLSGLYGHRIHTFFDDKREALPLARLLAGQPLGTHLYVCGPSGMIDWVLASAREAGWPDENVHSERFLAPPSGKPFKVDLAKSNKSIVVGQYQSVLEAVEAAGVDAPYLCRGGACGQCETSVIACDGAIHHNDHYLTDEEKRSGKKMMICVSRIDGAGVVLDL
ncbi:MAG: PDR/VanB family oxidoreductase [Hyphomicrobium sp.]|nr:PDR/VanB family oxidoreductase [Hyphomicrobium sp.]